MISLTQLKKPIYSLKTPMVSYKFLAINSLRGKHLNALICRSYKFLQIYKVANTSFVVYIMLWDCRMQNWEAIPILTLLSNPSWLESRTNSAPFWLQMLLVNFWVQFVSHEETCHNQLWKQRSVSIWAKGIYMTSVWPEPQSVQQPVGMSDWDDSVWSSAMRNEKENVFFLSEMVTPGWRGTKLKFSCRCC